MVSVLEDHKTVFREDLLYQSEVDAVLWTHVNKLRALQFTPKK